MTAERPATASPDLLAVLWLVSACVALVALPFVPLLAVPLAVVSLVAGVVLTARSLPGRRGIRVAVIVVSGIALAAALLGALFLLPAGLQITVGDTLFEPAR